MQWWADFLAARAAAIDAMRAEGKSYEEIMRMLNMDPVQVRLIAERPTATPST